MKLTKEAAYSLLTDGLENPETIGYVPHSRYMGDLAGMIAGELGLDAEYAAVLGYIHDIGRKIDSDNHIFAGYDFLKNNGYEEYAYICLTHSFLNNDIECICAAFLSPESKGYAEVKSFVESHKNTDYDRIIQTCDLLCLHTGGTTLEKRIDDIEARRGTHYKSKYHRETAIAQKAEIEKRLGHSIYDFYEKLKCGGKCKYEFNAEKTKNECVQWIRDFFENSGKGCNAVVGISGGKDSSVVAALCTEALGKDRVIGVLMPNGEQADIDMAKLLVDHLGIKHYVINIKDAVEGLVKSIPFELSKQAKENLPPRIRMSTLYAVSQSHNGRVANTCNLSEDYVGYSTRYGDSVGDFSPCSNLTVREVKDIGRLLGLPDVLVDKVPIDGLCGKTDEENLGFTYAELDRYIREGIIEDSEKKEKIDRMHKNNLFKLKLMPTFKPQKTK